MEEISKISKIDKIKIEREIENIEHLMKNYYPAGLSLSSREVISFGVRQGMKRLRRELRWQNKSPPDGYDIDNHGYLVPNRRANLIIYIFEKYKEIKNINEIAFILNKNGIKTSRGKEWSGTKIYRILTNPIYKGVYKSKEIEAYIPEYQIVSNELWDGVNEILKQRKKPKPMSKERKKEIIDKVFGQYFEYLRNMEKRTEETEEERVANEQEEIDGTILKFRLLVTLKELYLLMHKYDTIRDDILLSIVKRKISEILDEIKLRI